ncbi:CheR family methyltransferase [Sanguibacter suaedae]|jgi:chemotaxis protein methyltransferase CheR|uniref:protein-glutamate O-methyltransferase n=1 Tax=Sanguibacter suaedae TaxID=2795737 RepID=A0A934I5G5_9MICO|nr:protein-glutamate O-methyltransferase CheR [Sanguibacter suaedae]MBI9114601.1 protein-glutamate O-methyltransferase CheR [Sanguibacter suaedae]
MTLTAETFTFVADLVRQRSAIHLAPGKEYLVESRLAPLARREGVTVDEYVRAHRTRPNQMTSELIVEALTTNETSWFRDALPFQTLAEHVLPDVVAARAPASPLRIWSAACSTGQEPYSIAMTLLDNLTAPAPRVEITATDLSAEVLAKADRGVYSQLEVNRGLPAKYLVKHFTRVGTEWQISEELRSMVRFTKNNLLDSPPAGGPFDVVFMRNVLIYFDVAVKRDILRRLRGTMRPGGYLVLGAAETTVGIDDAWSRVHVGRSSIYQNTPGSKA